MKTKILMTTLIIGMMLSSITSFGETRIDKCQDVQYARIHNGIARGEITRREAALLKKEQKYIRRAKLRVKADGIITPREKSMLKHKQNITNRHIQRLKNNSIDNK